MFLKHKLGLTSLLLLAFLLLISFSSNPPNGNTGAPDDSVCSTCHGGSGGGFNGNISLSGLPSVVNGGEVFDLTFTIQYTQGTPARGGFQAVALRDDINTNAGDFSNPGTSTNTNTAGNGREYVEHSPARMFGGGNTVEYTVEWEAPFLDEDVTIYACSILGNGSGSGGDKFITEQFNTTVIGGVAPLDVEITTSQDVSCEGENDGTATAMATGGTGPYEYEWENGETGPTAVNLDGGFHDVTVTDDAGEMASTSVFIDEPNEITLDITTIDPSCFGDTNGSIEIEPSGGSGGLECTFSTGQNDCTQTNLAPGTYFVTVTDNNNCSVTAEITLDAPEELVVDLVTTNESTAGADDGSITATPIGGTSPYSYLWSNGTMDMGTSSMIVDLPAGSYMVTVTDNNDCEIVSSAMVMAGDCNISAEASIQNISCFGGNDGSITLGVMNAAEPIEYSWSNGSTTQDQQNLLAGSFSVTIIDNGNCTFILDNITVEEPQTLAINVIDQINTECPDDETGGISLSISGGTGPYTLETTDGTTFITDGNVELNGLSAGLYDYTISDANGCMFASNFEIFSEDDQSPTLLLKEGFLYIGESGVSELSDFSLVDNGSFDNCGITMVNFPSAIYDCSQINVYEFEVSITDASGNTSEGIAVLNVIDTIPPVIDCSMNEDIVISNCEPVTYETPTATDNCNVAELILIEGLNSGSIFPAGTTTVTYQATDDCGWTSTCSFTVTVNIDLAVNASSSDVTCFGGSDGSITLDISGGTAPYSYIISPPVSDENNLPAGTYDILVTDESNCIAQTTVTVEEPQEIMAENVLITNAEPNQSNGSISIEVIGGQADYSFEWSDSNGNIISTEMNLIGVSIGTYSLVITDSNGCQSDVLNFTVDSTSSTADIDSPQISIGPNPATDLITIKQESGLLNEMHVFDSNGKLVDNYTINSKLSRYRIDHLPNGIYMLMFSNSKQRIIKQFLKL